jgi:hypothetical protein
MGQVGREFALAALAVLAGLPFGSALARAWWIIAGKPFDGFSVVGGLAGGLGWLVLFVAWRGQVDSWVVVGAPCAFVGCACLTGVGGIVWGQAS